jgi:hypothetical protein
MRAESKDLAVPLQDRVYRGRRRAQGARDGRPEPGRRSQRCLVYQRPLVIQRTSLGSFAALRMTREGRRWLLQIPA